MMSMQTLVDLWDVFHDGSIDQVSGEIPGDLELVISIEYLRKRFVHPGEVFHVTLMNCHRFEYCNPKQEIETEDVELISEIQPGILSADLNEAACRLFCDQGTIDMECQGFRLSLDPENEITLDELKAIASDYWNAFKTQKDP